MGECVSGYGTEHRTIEYVANVLDREDPNIDAYIGVETIGMLGKYYIMTIEDKEYYVRAVDVIAKRHYKRHKEIWGDNWLADIQSSLFTTLDSPVKGTLCRVRKRYDLPPMQQGVLPNTNR